MAKSEAEAEVNYVDLMFLQWNESTTIKNTLVGFATRRSFLDLQETWGVDGRGMALNSLFSWISTCFLNYNCLQGFRSWLKAGSQYDARVCVKLCHLHVDTRHNTRIDSDSILVFLCIALLCLVKKKQNVKIGLVHNMTQGPCVASSLQNTKIFKFLRLFHDKLQECNAEEGKGRIRVYHCVATSINAKAMQHYESPCVILWTSR